MPGVAGVHGPAPKGDTDQRFAVFFAPFPGHEFRHHQRYRMTTIDAQSLRFRILFYFPFSIITFPGNRGNSLDFLVIPFPGIKP